MPGATVASEVSCAWPIAAKLDMMPHTVPNRPTNGATEETTARLGSPPSERMRRSRAARAMASEMRDRNSPTVSPGMRRRTSSSPAATTPNSAWGISPPARAFRTALRRRVTETLPSMIRTQLHSEARKRTAMTAFPTRLASRKSPSGERSRPCCISTPRIAPRALYARVRPCISTPRIGAKASGRAWRAVHSLHQEAQQRAAGRGFQLLRVNRPIVVRVGALESDFDEGEILILADGLVVVRVGYLPVLGGDAVCQFLAVKRAIMIDIELVEQSACGGLRLVQINRSILVGVEGLERRRRERGRSARYSHRRRKSNRQQGRKREYLYRCELHLMLLEMITGREKINVWPPWLVAQRPAHANSIRLFSKQLQRNSHSSEDGDGPARPERLRVGNGRARHELPGRTQGAGGIITLIENVLNVAKNLHLLGHLVGGVHAKDGIARGLGNRVILVARKNLA